MNTKPYVIDAAQVDAVTRITVSRDTAHVALSQLELMSARILEGTVPPQFAAPMKASFQQKIGQLEDLGVSDITGLELAAWVTRTYAKLDATAENGNGWKANFPSLASGSNPAADSAEANRMAAAEQAAYG